MKTLMLTLTLLSATFALAFGEDKPADFKKPIMDLHHSLGQAAARKAGTAKDTNTPSLSAFDSWSNVTVQAGQTLTLPAAISDYTGAEQVSVTIGCTTSTNLQNTAIVVSWASSIAPLYIYTSIITGSSLLLPNGGGAVVPVFGSSMELTIVNNGTTSISCPQIAAYAVVH